MREMIRSMADIALEDPVTGKGGFTFIEVLIVSAILASSALVIFPMLKSRQSRTLNNNQITSAAMLRSDLVSLLQSDSAWTQLLNDPACGTSLACVLNRSDCSAKVCPAGQFCNPIPCFKDLAQRKLIDDNSPVLGFGLDQGSCTSFNANGVSPNCPFRYSLSWRPLCAAGSCVQPAIEIRGQLQTAMGPGGFTNPSAFDFIVRH